MDRQRAGQKKKGNRNQQGGRGGKKPGFVTNKNRFGGNAGPKAKGGRKGNLGGKRQNVAVNKTKTTTITRTVNDLRQLIRPKNDKKPKVGAAKVTVQNKKSSIKKRLGLQSSSARAATVTARRNVTSTATRMEVDRVTIPKITVRNRNLNNTINARVQSKNRVWRRNDPLVLTQSQPVAPTVIIAQAPPPPFSSTSSSRSKARGNSVVISNLKAGISRKDVEDLFGDIGPASVQMIDSHTAIVTYGDTNHASRAVDVYHNRLLDGYPMQCTLIPASHVEPTASSSGFVSRTMRQIFT